MRRGRAPRRLHLMSKPERVRAPDVDADERTHQRLPASASPAADKDGRRTHTGCSRYRPTSTRQRSDGHPFEVIVSVEVVMNDQRSLEQFEPALAAMPEAVEAREGARLARPHPPGPRG